MPFLRRRGVMASETDLRRHTTLTHHNSTTALNSEPTTSASTSVSGSALASASTPALTNRNNGDNGKIEEEEEEEESNGGGSSDLVGTSASDYVATANAGGTGGTGGAGADSEIRNGAGFGRFRRQSEDIFGRPESPPVQPETPKHNRFSMLRFRTASDSQLSARSRLHQAEKPPPMPQRTSIPSPIFPLSPLFVPFPLCVLLLPLSGPAQWRLGRASPKFH